MLGPGQVEHLAEGVGPQAGVAVGAGQRPLDAHVGDLAHRPGGQAVAAGLLPGEHLLLDQGHVPPGLGQPVGAGGPGRAAPHDQDVVDVVGPGRSRDGGPSAGWAGDGIGGGWAVGSRPQCYGAAGPGRHAGRAPGPPVEAGPADVPAGGVRGKNKSLWTITCRS